MSHLKIILPNRSAKFLTLYHLVGFILIFSQVNISRSKDSVYFGNSTNKYDYLSDVIKRYKRQNLDSGVKCELPSNPIHGRYAILGDSVTSYVPGGFANNFRILQTHCNPGYAISPFERNTTICINGNWDSLPTACLRTCLSLVSTETTKVKCSLNQVPLANCMNPVIGTRTRLSCYPLYEEYNIERNPTRVCRASGWYPATSTCYPTCGNKRPKGIINIMGSQNVSIGENPWHVGIYNSTTKALLCGGSIIDQNFILTAAHCVTNYAGNVHPAGQYLVAAGKYFSRYDDPRDLFVQYSKVLTIHVPIRYVGLIHFSTQDIAVLKLETHFTISEGVQPICIELNEDSSDVNFLSASENGGVTGWGSSLENGEVSDVVLKELAIPLIPFEKCFSELPESFRRYLTFDKICGTSICAGDSGSALVFKNLINNRFFVKGIASISPATDELTCDPNHYSLFTSVDKHISFVRDLLTDNQFRTSIERLDDNYPNEANHEEITSTKCQIPNYGPHVRYAILGAFGNAYQIPGADVPQYAMIEISCDLGYRPNVFSDLRTICMNGTWSPSLTLRCLGSCPSLNSTTSTSVSCKYHDIPLKNCQAPIANTTALLLCNPLYEDDTLQNNVIHTCAEGSWIPAISECRPMCGVKRPKGRPNIINGQNATMGDYPWQVGIYDHQKKLICGGSILDRNIILTAASCLTNINGQVHQVLENYHIAAGKYYREYEDHRDEFVQYSKILQVHVPKRYRGIISSFAENIAIVILTHPFTIMEAVQPVCVQLNNETPYLHLSVNSSGIITGWGYTQEGSELSDVLKELVVPIIPFDQCFEEVPNNFKHFLAFDQICAGYLNKGKSVCSGDTGGALILKNILSERYYVEGIASMSPASMDSENSTCNSNQYSLYTSIMEHIDFIKNLLAQHQIPQSIESEEEEATRTDDNDK